MLERLEELFFNSNEPAVRDDLYKEYERRSDTDGIRRIIYKDLYYLKDSKSKLYMYLYNNIIVGNIPYILQYRYSNTVEEFSNKNKGARLAPLDFNFKKQFLQLMRTKDLGILLPEDNRSYFELQIPNFRHLAAHIFLYCLFIVDYPEHSRINNFIRELLESNEETFTRAYYTNKYEQVINRSEYGSIISNLLSDNTFNCMRSVISFIMRNDFITKNEIFYDNIYRIFLDHVLLDEDVIGTSTDSEFNLLHEKCQREYTWK